MTARVLIAVTHLLGSGHLVRAGHLARALAEAGFAVTLASGGMPLRAMAGEPFAFVQLPPVKVEGVDFRNLLDEAGRPVDAARLAARRAMLGELVASLRPDVVITEHFPFGRRQLADEFLGLIAAARQANPRALVLASIRDVLVTPKPDRIVEAEQRIAAHFDAVLVHGDARFLPLEASWPVGAGLAGKLIYTGYLAAPGSLDAASPGAKDPRSPLPVPLAGAGKGAAEILVSGGGSGAALPLFSLCLAAAKLDSSRRWRLLVGRGADPAAFAALQAVAPVNATVEPARPDFPALLAGCALSISQAGYNTVLDLVAAGRPAIVVPFDEGAETEQAIRAEAMARAGLAACLRLGGGAPLTPAILAEAVESALQDPAPAAPAIDRDGAGAVAGIVTRLLAERR